MRSRPRSGRGPKPCRSQAGPRAWPQLGRGPQTEPLVGAGGGVLYWNIRGLLPQSNKTKVCYLRDLARLSTPLGIVLTETHLSDSVLSAEVSILGYTLYRSDRQGRTHGGTCVYVRDDLAAQLLLSHSNSVCESLVVKVKTLDLILVTIYRPPYSSLEKFRDAIDMCQDVIAEAMG